MIFQTDGAVQFINSTISGFDVGLYVTNGDPGLVVRNSILDNNDDLFDVPTTGGFQYSLISDGELAGTNGNITGSPLFVDAANGDINNDGAVNAADVMLAYRV